MLRRRFALVLAAAALAGAPVAALAQPAASPRAVAATTCSDYPNQAAAQRAADTRDPDGDGIYCESLPCPCSSAAGGGTPTPPTPSPKRSCTRPRSVQSLAFSATKYPNIRAHFRAAVRRGWPRTLVVNRPGADARRDRLLEDVPTRAGFDRDEYPPAVGRGRGKGLVRGSSPRGWKADVEYVESSENQSHGASLGGKLRRFCNGTRFRYVFGQPARRSHQADPRAPGRTPAGPIEAPRTPAPSPSRPSGRDPAAGHAGEPRRVNVATRIDPHRPKGRVR